MRLIKISQSEKGSHAYQTIDRVIEIPKGWAVIPDDMETPNLPFGDITVEDIDGVPTVTSWTPREMPEVPEAEAETTAQEDTDAMLVDHEYRLTLLELGGVNNVIQNT